MCETVERIENPGMCYSLRMEHIAIQQKSKQEEDTSEEKPSERGDATTTTTTNCTMEAAPVGACAGRTRSSQRHSTKRIVPKKSSSIRMTDNKNGLGFGQGIYLDGPSENGTMILRNGHGRARAVLKPTFHPTYSFYYEMLCPNQPSNLLLKDTTSTGSTSCSLGSSWSSLDQHLHHHSSFNESTPEDEDGEVETDMWFTWGTVHTIPHSLDYQMTLWLPQNNNNNNGDNHHPSGGRVMSWKSSTQDSYSNTNEEQELVYILRYCGAIFAASRQMRIDKESDNLPVALMSENTIDPPTSIRSARSSSEASTSSCASTASGVFVLDHKNKVCSTESPSWDLVIGPGVDPSLMICFAAIVNHGRSSYYNKR
jgi:hypothetical protein